MVCLTTDNRAKLMAYLGSWQFGAGQPGGAEAAQHLHRLAALRALALGKPHLIVNADARNAFGNVSRRLAVEILTSVAPDMGPFVRMVYGASAPVHLWGEVLEAARGVLQGDPLSPILYSLVHKMIQDMLLVEFPDLLSTSYMDDTTIGGDPARVLEALRRVAEVGGSGPGWVPRYDKYLVGLVNSHIMSPEEESHLQAGLADLGIPHRTRIDSDGRTRLDLDAGITILGTPVHVYAQEDSRSRRRCEAALRKCLDDATAEIDELKRVESNHLNFLLLRHCTATGQINHLLRSVAPHQWPRQGLEAFDKKVLDSLSGNVSGTRTGHPDVSERTESLSRVADGPRGGLGFKSAAELKDSAFFASMYDGYGGILFNLTRFISANPSPIGGETRTPEEEARALMDECLQGPWRAYWDGVRSTPYDEEDDHNDEGVLLPPLSPDDRDGHKPFDGSKIESYDPSASPPPPHHKRTQRRLGKRRARVHVDKVNGFDIGERLYLREARAQTNGAFVTAVPGPGSGALRMDNDVFAVALQLYLCNLDEHLLREALGDDTPYPCQNRNWPGPPQPKEDHTLPACNTTGMFTQRHNLGCSALVEAVNDTERHGRAVAKPKANRFHGTDAAGNVVIREPGDVVISNFEGRTGTDMYVDVTMVDMEAKSNRGAKTSALLSALERDKENMYLDIVEDNGHMFMALPFTARGGEGGPSAPTTRSLERIFGVKRDETTDEIIEPKTWDEYRNHNSLAFFRSRLSSICFKTNARAVLWHVPMPWTFAFCSRSRGKKKNPKKKKKKNGKKMGLPRAIYIFGVLVATLSLVPVGEITDQLQVITDGGGWAYVCATQSK